jgi:uncharacterized protein GlcG (DUF336 family)
MPTLLKCLAAITAICAMTAQAGAQMVANERNLTFAAARAMADAALDDCRGKGFHISVHVLDRNGNIRIAVRDDGTSIHTFDASFRKAYTARAFRVPSIDWGKRAESSEPALKQVPNTLGLAGGLPVKIGDETIGSIGVAGAPGATGDAACAAAGLKKIEDQLK